MTNQSGVALKEGRFDKLDMDRAKEVNEEIIERLNSHGAYIEDSVICPYVDLDYLKKANKKKPASKVFVSDGIKAALA